MEKPLNLCELNAQELKEINGGFPLLVIRLFIPTPQTIIGFIEGLREGYERTTPP
jgi:hypothetical protein